MVQSKTQVTRTLVLLERDEEGEFVTRRIDALVALARCPRCKRRARILPCNVLPYKIYALEVIEHQKAEYLRGSRGLRPVAWSLLGERTPTHTTLHAWSEGMGAHMLGRFGSVVEPGEPISRVLIESESRAPAVADDRRADVAINPIRYRSVARLERLIAGARLLLCAQTVAGSRSPHSLSCWRADLLTWRLMSPLRLRTGISRTRIGHAERASAGDWQCPEDHEGIACPTRTRSPPGASSRSLPSSMHR